VQPQELEHGGEHIQERAIALDAPGSRKERGAPEKEGDTDALVIEVGIVPEAGATAVKLAMSLAMVSDNHDEGVLELPSSLKRLHQFSEKSIGIAKGIKVALKPRRARKGSRGERIRDPVVVMAREGKQGEEKG
jgi:hypothetical protein